MDRRDRHGRGMRGPLARPPVPLARTRREDFEDLVLDAADRVRTHLPEGSAEDRALDDVVFVVEDIPDPEAVADVTDRRDVPLGHVEERTDTAPPAVVVYRRPVEARASRGPELEDLVLDVVVEQVAELLGLDPEDLDPGPGR